MMPSLPPEYATVGGLGDFVKLYTSRALSRWLSMCFVLLFLLLPLGLGYYALIGLPREYGSSPLDSGNLAMLGFALLMLAVGLALLWSLAARWRESIALYEGGFARSSGKRLDVVRWEEIQALQMQVTEMSAYGVVPLSTVREYKIDTGAGRPLQLQGALYSLRGIDELMAAIRANVLRVLLPRYRREYEGGTPVRFGPLTLDCVQGLTAGGKTFNLADVTVVVTEGQVKIKPKKRGLFGGAGVPVKKVPNLDIFLALVWGPGSPDAPVSGADPAGQG